MSYAPRSDGPKKGSEISESTGPVAKDSLAAESIRDDGGFAENTNPEILGVKGSSSTLANTDTSGAETLPAASSRAERSSSQQDESTDEPQKLSTLPPTNPGGTTSPEGYSGGSTRTSTTTGERIDNAPSYTSSSTGALRSEGELRPKGENLVEGGDIPENRKTFTGDVGGNKDPGRVAERKMLSENADGSGGVVRDRGEVDGENPYAALRSSDRA